MPRVSHAHCHKYVRERMPFYGSNMSGTLEGDTYIVYSYAAPILVYSNLTNRWFVTQEKFSVTTSRHVGYASWGVSPQHVRHYDLLQVIAQPEYIPLTEPQKMGIAVGDLCHIKHSNGVFRKGSVVRVAAFSWWDSALVTEVMAVRTKRYANTYWNEPTMGVAVRLHALEKVHD